VIRLAKARTIAWFELTSTVRRTGYLVVTLGMPLFVLLYGALALIPGYFLAKNAAGVRTHGIVDRAGVLGLEVTEELSSEKVVFRRYGDETAAKSALSRRLIRSYYVLPSDYVASGRVEAYGLAQASLGPWEAKSELDRVLRERLLWAQAGPGVQREVSERIVTPVKERETFRLSRGGQVEREGQDAFIGRLLLPLGFVFLLFSSILMSGSYLIQATAGEKENKVIEVLLSSASADEIMTGKLFGLGGAGLLQVVVWLSMTLGVRFGFMSALAPMAIEVSWQAVAVAPVLFILAYAFLGSLMLGTGSFGANVRESQQLGMVWALFATIPLVFLPVIITDPHGTVAHVLTWIPFSAPATLVFRLSLDPDAISSTEIVGSTSLLLVSTWATVRIASRLFRVGLLLTGARPSLREIIRQARIGQ
jgi:ABC-2 type transport system permease protein